MTFRRVKDRLFVYILHMLLMLLLVHLWMIIWYFYCLLLGAATEFNSFLIWRNYFWWFLRLFTVHWVCRFKWAINFLICDGCGWKMAWVVEDVCWIYGRWLAGESNLMRFLNILIFFSNFYKLRLKCCQTGPTSTKPS